MQARVKLDGKGRITIPRAFREALGVREGDELVVRLSGGKLVVEKAEDPFRVLESILGDLSFSRELRREAEEALRTLGGRRLGCVEDPR